MHQFLKIDQVKKKIDQVERSMPVDLKSLVPNDLIRYIYKDM